MECDDEYRDNALASLRELFAISETVLNEVAAGRLPDDRHLYALADLAKDALGDVEDWKGFLRARER